jgi:uncharacterized protein YcgI (DUF1989 family)
MAVSLVPEPADAARRRAAKPVVVYPPETLPAPDLKLVERARPHLSRIDETVVPPRDARTFHVPRGHIFRIVSIDGPQVGDLNLWSAGDLTEHFFSGKTRALHGTHVTTGARLWSTLPFMRPMATVTQDTLGWYGFDADGGGIHDVLNVFMCTGFTSDTHQYFMKASPVRPGDYIEFVADIDLLGALSACPGGDCSASHSSDAAKCHPLLVEIYKPPQDFIDAWPRSPRSQYPRTHGT